MLNDNETIIFANQLLTKQVFPLAFYFEMVNYNYNLQFHNISIV